MVKRLPEGTGCIPRAKRSGKRSALTQTSRVLVIVLICLCCFLRIPTPAAGQVEIEISGVSGDVLENVRSALIVPESLQKKGRTHRMWVEYFKKQVDEKVRTALEPYGYYAPEVQSTLDITDSEKYLIKVQVNPGEPVRLTRVSIAVQGPGAQKKSLQEVIAQFPLKKGDILLHGEYEKMKGELKARALETGYLDAEFTDHRILVNRKEASAEIALAMETGPQYFYGITRFEGAPSYEERFLRRYLAYKQGDVLSSVKLRKTQLNLMNSERFSEVVPTPEKEKEKDLQVPVVIKLTQSPSRQLRAGIGYGTDTGARFSVKYTDLNNLKRGYELRSELNVSERLQGVGISYVIPSYRDLNSFTEFKANARNEDVDTYETQVLSVEASRTKSLGRGRSGTVYLRLQHEDSTIASDQEKTFLVMPGVRFSANRYNNLTRPTSGYLYAAEVRGTHKYLGSDTGLLQVILQGSTIVPLPWRCLLYARIQGALTAQDESLRQIPASIRFFTGGDRSVRGYKYQSLGPEDEKGNVIGGKHLLVGSLELERALFSDWGVAVFYDTGNSFNSLSDIQLYQGAGIGVRYYTRIGAIRIDIARQIDVENPKFRLHFSIGIEL
ncbi:MAG: autotransporter assembly complex family protein [Nitrospirota bacterium]